MNVDGPTYRAIQLTGSNLIDTLFAEINRKSETIERLRAMLRKVGTVADCCYRYCPYCHAMETGSTLTHAPDCEWVKEMGTHAKSDQVTQTETPTTTGPSA